MKIRFLALFLFTIGFVHADDYPKNESIDIKHYKFRLELNDTTDIISGQATIQLRVLKTVTDFELDLINQNNQKKGMAVSRVVMQGKELKYTHQNNRLKIFLPDPASANENLTLTIDYSGVPADGLIISENKYGDRTFFGDNWPDRARNWLPCIDHPYDKAGVDFIVVAPLHYMVVGNGIKLEESYLNATQKNYSLSKPSRATLSTFSLR